MFRFQFANAGVNCLDIRNCFATGHRNGLDAGTNGKFQILQRCPPGHVDPDKNIWPPAAQPLDCRCQRGPRFVLAGRNYAGLKVENDRICTALAGFCQKALFQHRHEEEGSPHHTIPV